MQNIEIIETLSTSISCFGKEAIFDHPKIYLEIDPVYEAVVCPYCSRTFVLIK